MIPLRTWWRTAVLLLTLVGFARGADWSARGYVLGMPLAWDPPALSGTSGGWRGDAQVLARQNLRWYPRRSLTLALEVNERLLAGESAGPLEAASGTYRFEEPYFDLSHTFVDREKAVLGAGVERLWVTAYAGDLQVTAGRQRIAWGTALVWNPTDLFNPTSPLDFANVEKPGADGVRVQYFLGPASSLEVAGALREPEDESIVAAKLVLNRWTYDVHLLAGHRYEEWVAGVAWAGNLKEAGFRGEALGRFPTADDLLNDDPGYTVVLSADYAFEPSLYLHGEALYSSRGTTGDAGGRHLIEALRDRRLTPARWSLFAEAARDLHPLVTARLSGILNPNDGSWYLGPTLTWNALTNVDVTLSGLAFCGGNGTEFGDNGTILLTQARWSW